MMGTLVVKGLSGDFLFSMWLQKVAAINFTSYSNINVANIFFSLTNYGILLMISESEKEIAVSNEMLTN